jgi:CheY-like chemotaxis protein
MDGIEVLRNIRANESTRTIPVVIMTSSNEDKDILASYQLGVNSYVVKPVEFDEFVKAVGNLGLYWLLTNRAVSSPKAP